MAFVYPFNTNENGRIACWKFDEQLSELYHIIGNLDYNLTNYHLLGSKDRKIEWLASRILLYQMTQNKSIDIDYDHNGKPHLANSEEKISISHSKGMCAMYLSNQSNGIDLQILNIDIAQIQHKYLNPEEINLVNNELDNYHYFWSAKEAVFKAYGRKKIFLKQNIFIKEIDNEQKTITAQLIDGDYKQDYQLVYRKIENYFMVYTT